MSREYPFQRFGTQRDDIETLPFARTTEAWYEERDLGDEGLPSYSEAIANRPITPSQQSITATQQQRPHEQMTLATPPQSGSQTLSSMSGKSLRNFSPCLLAPVIALVMGAVFSGVTYVNDYANPTPGTASPTSLSEDKAEFIIWVILWGLIAYPFLFTFLLLITPRIFGLPKATDKPANAQPTWRTRQSKKIRNRCCGLYCGLTVLYFGIVAVGLWGTLFLANTKLQQTFVLFSGEDWAGNYVVVEKALNGSTVSLFSRSGQQLGDVSFTDLPAGWSMEIDGSAESIQKIVYINTTISHAIEVSNMPILFNATCRAPSNNISNPCFFGGLDHIPVPYSPGLGDHPVAEFDSPINLTISALNDTAFLNITSTVTGVWTNDNAYQGIGLKYPPLGSWYLNTTPILEVMWSTSGTSACQGLLINLSKDHEILAWPILGMIWEWWEQWGENGGCTWS